MKAENSPTKNGKMIFMLLFWEKISFGSELFWIQFLISGLIKATEKVCLSCRIFTLGFKDIFSPVPVGIEFLDLRHHFLKMPNPLAVIFMIRKIILLAIHGAIFGKSTSATRHQIAVLWFLAMTTKRPFRKRNGFHFVQWR